MILITIVKLSVSFFLKFQIDSKIIASHSFTLVYYLNSCLCITVDKVKQLYPFFENDCAAKSVAFTDIFFSFFVAFFFCFS